MTSRRIFAVQALCGITALSARAQAGAQEAPRLRSRELSEIMLQSTEGLAYHIKVSTPQGAPPPGGFPVFYILDGDAWFNTAVEVARVREWGHLAPSLIVGVGYPSGAFFDPRRNVDFTPPGSADPDFAAEEQGGAARFLNFLESVLKPRIEARYAIDGNRGTLFGHSLGGLFVLHAMFTAPRSFNVYLAASPAIRFSNRIVLQNERDFEANPARANVRALITVGGLESRPNPEQVDDYRRYFIANPGATGGLSVEEALRQTFPPLPPGFNKARELHQLAQRLSRSGAHVTFTEFAGVEHTPAAVNALNDGIAFALRPMR